MPVHQDPKTRKWAIGSGKYIYRTKGNAKKAYHTYLIKKHVKEKET